MLHPTQHPSFLQFPSPTILSPSLSSTSLQVQPEMECVEAALKTSFRKEMSMKSTPQAFFDDLWSLNLPTGVASDDFFVDDLFDFSNDEGLVEEEEAKVSASSPKQATPDDDKYGDNCSHFSAKNDFCPLPATELVVPADDLASLEWLSQFVEDSNSEYSAPFPALAEKPKTEARPEPGTAVPETDPETCFKTPVPAKARSKRTRTGVRVWPLGSPSLTESSSSSTTSSSSSSPSSPRLIYANPGTSLNLEPTDPVSSEKLAAKRLKKKPATDVANAQPPRRCSHCGVQKTPQWRAGPLGAKTLCNACGVRFKSGRLLPEYRPACSPTFSSELHSNHHRKVLEMRKKKEIMGQAEAGVVAAAVASF